MLAVKTRYDAWIEILRGISIGADATAGLAAHEVARSHANQAANIIANKFSGDTALDVRMCLARWIEGHLAVASEAVTKNMTDLRAETDRLAHALVAASLESPEPSYGRVISRGERVEMVEQRLHEFVDAFIELLASKIERQGIRKAQKDARGASRNIARFAAEWRL